ncbi:hypothetical protein KR018_002413 [Drosophila ironensis]|nr:hypothetical protein KR018_002413 [Drosophila ironensis]
MAGLSPNPSVASTYLSEDQAVEGLPQRRSQRLIEKDTRILRCTSPPLFAETEDECSQLQCQQPFSGNKIVHLKAPKKATRGRQTPLPSQSKIVHLQASQKSTSPTKISPKIPHLSPEIDKENQQKAKTNAPPQRNRKRRAEQAPTEPQKKAKIESPSNLRESQLPNLYPSHFVHQLPPFKDKGFVHQRAYSAPAIPPSADATPETEQGELKDQTPSLPDTEDSIPISLSDSIGEVFGTKDVRTILNVECPKLYILSEEHLPSIATLLHVDVGRLQNVLEMTQRLSHEQILQLPMQQDQSPEETH